MKKLLFVSGLALSTLVVSAQKLTWGGKAGLNLSHISTNDADINSEKSMLPTFHVGVVADYAISNRFSIQPQLLLQGKGTKIAHEGHSDKYSFTSLDLPINFLYRSKGFFVGGGPNLGFNLSGKVKSDEAGEGGDIEFGTDPGQIKRFDFGVNALAGYQWKSGLFFSANYTLGVANWSNVSGSTWRNNILGVSLGYMLKGKK